MEGMSAEKILIAGGGIGGLAAALALCRAGASVRIRERADAFGEIGAGIQMGPNVVRVLDSWGLAEAVRRVAAQPEQLVVRRAADGSVLAALPLARAMQERYGAPYLTIHRADLHSSLFAAVAAEAGLSLQVGRAVSGFEEAAGAVQMVMADGTRDSGDALIGADGLWSAVRVQLLGGRRPVPTGHLAYRALVRQVDLPVHLRSQDVTVWMGPRLHVVHYPVRGGDWLNVVGIVHGALPQDVTQWDHAAQAGDLSQHLRGAALPLLDLVGAVDFWRLWVLNDRPPVASAREMAQGRVALLGDAAHPMRPYLAQGAGMAIEDAQALAAAVSHGPSVPMAERLQQYAKARWARNARVQARSVRNGRIFHAQGPMRWGRDAALQTLGERLMDVPWLYGWRGSEVGA
jgi:salicylate hydroxylase